MRTDKLTIKTREALADAQELAAGLKNQEVTPEHVLVALLKQRDGIVGPLVQKVGADPEVLVGQVMEVLERGPKVKGAALEGYIGNRTKELLNEAFKQADKFKDEYVSTEHLFLALVTKDLGEASRALGKLDPVIGRDEEIRRVIQVL